jgi:hypothetical protein
VAAMLDFYIRLAYSFAGRMLGFIARKDDLDGFEKNGRDDPPKRWSA